MDHKFVLKVPAILVRKNHVDLCEINQMVKTKQAL